MAGEFFKKSQKLLPRFFKKSGQRDSVSVGVKWQIPKEDKSTLIFDSNQKSR